MKKIVFTDVVEVTADLDPHSRKKMMIALNKHLVGVEDVNIPADGDKGFFITDPEVAKHPNYGKLEKSHYTVGSHRVKLCRTVYEDGSMSFEVKN